MLKGIDPVLSGELLKVLDEMGHADVLALVDRNYPAYATGRPVISLGDITQKRAVEAILSVFPLDTFVPQPLARMEAEDDPTLLPAVQEEVLAVAQLHHPEPLEYRVIPRLEFYERAREAYAVVRTLESRPYGCFLLQKGVVFD
jgi:L-fucose mutarotase